MVEALIATVAFSVCIAVCIVVGRHIKDVRAVRAEMKHLTEETQALVDMEDMYAVGACTTCGFIHGDDVRGAPEVIRREIAFAHRHDEDDIVSPL